MELPDRRRSSSSTAPLSRSDSTASLGSFRPSLVWLFNHIRRDDRDCLTLEDLQQLLGATVNSSQLDEAFGHLDLDKDGEISLDEFIAGFAKFWKEAPHTPGYDALPCFTFTPPETVEEHYESDREPSHHLNQSLAALSSHNRHSIEHLWASLSEQNPDLLSDFEEFVAEVAGEVQVAQRALDNQRLAIKKEAHELDEEMESRLNDAHTTLTIQTNLVKEQVKVKLEQRLSDKEGELMFIRSQLNELNKRLDACTCLTLQLEEEVVDTQRQHSQLHDEIQALHQEKSDLHERLADSEQRLLESQSAVATIQSKALIEVETQQRHLHFHEEELLKQKKEFEASVALLKEQLSVHTQQPSEPSRLPSNEATPDLLATSQPRPRGSLRDEIVQQEGMASSLLRKEHVLEPSPFRDRSRSSVMIKRPLKIKKEVKSLKESSGLSMSLPNLADIDELFPARQPLYIPVHVGANEMSHGGDHVTEPIGSTSKKAFNTDANSVHKSPAKVSTHTTRYQAGNDDKTSSMAAPVTTKRGLNTSISLVDHRSSLSSDHPLQREGNWQQCQPIDFIPALKDSPDYMFRILVVGDTFVGKSSFLDRLCNNSFSQNFASTVGVDFHSKALRTEDKKIVSLQLWDTAGQERFQSITKTYYRGANGVILMYDISQEATFLSVKTWLNAIHQNAGPKPPSALVLVGNKMDLEEESQRAVLSETGESFAKMYGAEFIETSAKTGFNVANCLLMLVRAIKDSFDSEGIPPLKEGGQNVEQFHLVEQQPPVTLNTKQSGNSCCSRS